MRQQEAFKDFWRSGGSGSYLEPEIDLNTYFSYEDLLLEDILVFLFKSKIIFALYLDDPDRFAGILCPPGWRYSKNLTFSYVSYPYFKKLLSYSPLPFTHRKWDRKNWRGGGRFPRRPLRVNTTIMKTFSFIVEVRYFKYWRSLKSIYFR